MQYRLLKEAALQSLIEEDIPYDRGSTNLYLVALEMGNGATDIILADRKPSVEEAQKYYEEVTGFSNKNLPPTENNLGTTVIGTRVISTREARKIDPEFEDSPFINGKIPPFAGGGAGYDHPRHWERNFGGLGVPFPHKKLGQSAFSNDEASTEDNLGGAPLVLHGYSQSVNWGDSGDPDDYEESSDDEGTKEFDDAEEVYRFLEGEGCGPMEGSDWWETDTIQDRDYFENGTDRRISYHPESGFSDEAIDYINGRLSGKRGEEREFSNDYIDDDDDTDYRTSGKRGGGNPSYISTGAQRFGGVGSEYPTDI